MHGALLRYRIVAWIVGVCLLVLTLIAMPLKYVWQQDTAVAIVGPVHGFLFMGYLATAFDVSRRWHWPFGRMILVMVAGTVPFLSFWAERKVSREWTPITTDEKSALHV